MQYAGRALKSEPRWVVHVDKMGRAPKRVRSARAARLRGAVEGPEAVQSHWGPQHVCGKEIRRGQAHDWEGLVTEEPADAGHPFPEGARTGRERGEGAQRGARTLKAVVWRAGARPSQLRARGMRREGTADGDTDGHAVLLSQGLGSLGQRRTESGPAGVGGDCVKRQAA